MSPRAPTIARPLHIVFVTAGDKPAAMSAVARGVEDGRARSLVESHEGPASRDYQVNTALESRASGTAPRSITSRSRRGHGGTPHRHLLGIDRRAGTVRTISASRSAERWSAIRLFLRFAGEGGFAGIRGASLLARVVSTPTRSWCADHAPVIVRARNCSSRCSMAMRAACSRATSRCDPGAQKTDARMMTRALLLSETAEADSKPELEIFADDVQCGHGATTGALDPELKFYLMARGIPAKQAETLLMQAFIGEAIDGVGPCRAARSADGRNSRLARWARDEAMHPAVTNGSYDVGRDPRGFSDPGHEGARQAAGLSRQRRIGAEAESGARPPAAGLHAANMPTFIAGCIISPMRPPRPTRARARRCARFLNAARPEEIIFTRGATEAINLVAHTFGRERIKPGDEIVLSIMEHHANIVPWHFLRERHGAVIKWAPVDDDGNFLIDEFEKLLTDRTKMVAITHMSNVLGTIVPVKEVVRIAHARGIPVLVDGAQAAVHLDVDVRDIDCDFYVDYRPQALRPDRNRRAVRQARAPGRHAAVQRRRRNDPRGVRGSHHLRRPAAPVRGRHAARSCRRSGSAPRSTISIRSARRGSGRTKAILSPTRTSACAKSIRCASSAPQRTRARMVSFDLNGAHPHDFATIIDRSGVAVRAGTHCAMPLLKRFGVPATCRASFALYNTREEVDCLVTGAHQGTGVLRMTKRSMRPVGSGSRASPGGRAAPRPANCDCTRALCGKAKRCARSTPVRNDGTYPHRGYRRGGGGGRATSVSCTNSWSFLGRRSTTRWNSSTAPSSSSCAVVNSAKANRRAAMTVLVLGKRQ